MLVSEHIFHPKTSTIKNRMSVIQMNPTKGLYNAAKFPESSKNPFPVSGLT